VTTTTTVSTAVCACPSGAVVVNVCGISVVIGGGDGVVLVDGVSGMRLDDGGEEACEGDEDADDAGTELEIGEREEEMDRDIEDVGEDAETVPEKDERLVGESTEGDDGLLETGGLDDELDPDLDAGMAGVEPASPVDVGVSELDTEVGSSVSAGVLGEDAVLVDVTEEAGEF
jgi:hypothetical protein